MIAHLQIGTGAPLHACTRAAAELKQFSRGQRNYSRIQPHSYLVIRLGRRWRLLSKNGGASWALLTHEKYNTECKK